jgi:hypothetical protein
LHLSPPDFKVRALMTPERRAFLTNSLGGGLSSNGKHLIWWQDGTLPKTERLEEFLAHGDKVRALFPISGLPQTP